VSFLTRVGISAQLREGARKILLFLKKKKQKDSYPFGAGALGNTEFRTKRAKVFCFFSSEKKASS